MKGPIVLASPEYPAEGRYGGIGVFFRDLTVGLRDMGLDARLLVTAPGPSRRLTEFAVTVREPRGGPFHQVTRSIALAQVAMRNRPRVVFAPEFGGLAWALTRRPGAPPVVTSLATSRRQLEIISPPGVSAKGRDLGGFVAGALERDQTRRSALVIAPSSAMLRWATELWDLDATACVIPNLIPYGVIRGYATAPQPPWWPDGEEPVVLFAGRLELRKGIDVLARAAAQSWSNGATWRLVVVGADTVVGDTSGSDLIRQAVPPHVRRRLVFVGARPQEELFAAFARAAVTVFPSRWEAFGLVALEAMASGAAVLATSGSGFSDFVTDGVTGRLVPAGDSTELSLAIDELLRNPLMRRTLATAAQIAAGNFDVARKADRFAAAFESAIVA